MKVAFSSPDYSPVWAVANTGATGSAKVIIETY